MVRFARVIEEGYNSLLADTGDAIELHVGEIMVIGNHIAGVTGGGIRTNINIDETPPGSREKGESSINTDRIIINAFRKTTLPQTPPPV